jgi:hypothetical protein
MHNHVIPDSLYEFKNPKQGVVMAEVIKMDERPPSSVINTFNYELATYLKILTEAARLVNLSEKDSVENKELNSIWTNPDRTLGDLLAFANMLEGIVKDAKSASEISPRVPEASIIALQFLQILKKEVNWHMVAHFDVEAGKESAIPHAVGSADHSQCPLTQEQGKRYVQRMQLLEGLDKAILGLTSKFWSHIGNSVERQDMQKAVANLFKRRKDLLFNVKEHAVKMAADIERRGVDVVRDADEASLYKNLMTEQFALPLYVSVMGAAQEPLVLAQALSRQVINTENQKMIQSRVGCFALKVDQICKQFETAATGTGH